MEGFLREVKCWKLYIWFNPFTLKQKAKRLAYCPCSWVNQMQSLDSQLSFLHSLSRTLSCTLTEQGLEEASVKQAKIGKPTQEWKEGLYNIYSKLYCYYSAAKRCFTIVVLEKTLESPLDGKEIQLVHLKQSQSWIFIGRTDAEAETATWCEETTH